MKKNKSNSPKAASAPAPAELHQTSSDPALILRTNQGIPIADNQNSIKAGPRGPVLLEDFVLREKITHFDHERIPERIVHARGSGAHGYFQPYESCADITKAAFLQDPKKKTEVFARFSTVAGGAGSGDMPRDVRGFAVKFYTSEGNFDLVGNNIPVFFIQDAMKFPDLIHAVKMEADRGFPQAATAHDTFWDYISLTPESMHMVAWIMSDRTIPRSLRTMEGFGIHTFRMINSKGGSQFVKFHWRPTIGSASVVWDEALKINGMDPDFHRRDLWEAIETGTFPEWELGLQVFDQAAADDLDFDPLDPTKIIPEEIIPLRMIGKMVLNRNVDNFFAETEQVAFCPANIVPGIGFTNDPLLQGRLFSYLDTQLSRLGGPNFHQLPVNAPRCPFHNQQRDGIHQMQVPKGRANYEPNSIDPGKVRENPAMGYKPFPEEIMGEKTTLRTDTFADHYSQARLFYRSMTPTEQRHMVSALTFELGKVSQTHIRARMFGHLALIEPDLQKQVEAGLGMEGNAEKIQPAVSPRDLETSDALSILKKAKPTLKGRQLGILIADGHDAGLLTGLRNAAKKEGAAVAIVAPKVGGATDNARNTIPANHSIAGGPSVMFDTVAILLDQKQAEFLATQAAALDWVSDAFAHCKVIAHTPAARPLLEKAGVEPDDGVIELADSRAISQFINAAKKGRIWDREPKLHAPMFNQ
ncbi:MAG TPA: catalase [Verrucomicrobiae bacterium]|jgi:catalase|nr:catalase [Verrucomicrobiae bacterium]